MRRVDFLRSLSVAFVTLGIVTIGASAFVPDRLRPGPASAPRVVAATALPAAVTSPPTARAIVHATPAPRNRPRVAHRPRPHPRPPHRTPPAAHRIALAPKPAPRVALAPKPTRRTPSPKPGHAGKPAPKRARTAAQISALPRPRVAAARTGASRASFDAGYREAAESDYAWRAAWQVAASDTNYDPRRLTLGVQRQPNGVVRVSVYDRDRVDTPAATIVMKRTANGFAVLSKTPAATAQPTVQPATPTPSPTPAPRRRRRFL